MPKREKEITVRYRLKDGAVVERTHIVLAKGEELTADPVAVAKTFTTTTNFPPAVTDEDDSDD